MGNLVTTCPATGRKIELGIETDSISMELTPQFITQIDCPYCLKRHSVSKSDLFVCEIIDGVVRYLRAA
jgi:hypothetical protein